MSTAAAAGAGNEQAWAAAAAWGRVARMNEIETMMWRTERHPRLSSTVCTVMLLDRAPEWDRLVAAHEWATQLIPRCRDRVLEPAWPVGPAAWVPDEDFALANHLSRVQLPGPGTLAALLEYAQGEAMVGFDRSRPLWHATLIEGLADGRAGYLLKLHHSLSDGLGGIQLMSLVQSRTREPTANKPGPSQPPPVPHTDATELAVAEVSEQVRQLPALLRGGVRAVLGAVAQPGEAMAEAIRFGASLRRTLTPPPAPPSPLLHGRTGKSWRFEAMECPLPELKLAARAAGGSLNDAYVAALLGGLRRYHEHHGTPVDELPMAMPINLRTADDPMGGNKFAGAFFAAPVGVEDPAERIATIRGLVLSLRVEPALDTFSLVAPVLNRIPSVVGEALYDRVGGVADLSASNVPGLPYDTYLAGAKVQRVFPFGPLPGVAIMAAMVSHAGTCCFGFNIDADAVDDVETLLDCLRAGLDEVLALAVVG